MNKKIVFSFTHAGIFSEINNLLLTILYSQKKEYDVIIDYSSLKSIDYETMSNIFDLHEFCTNKLRIIEKASTRSIKTYLSYYSVRLKILKMIKYYFYNTQFRLYKLINHLDIELFQQHWKEIRLQRLNLNNNEEVFLMNTASKLWKHKKKYEYESSNKFVGVHLRRGDKITETDYIPLKTYYNTIDNQCRLNGIRSIFLFTDNYQDGLVLKKMLNDYDVRISCLDKKGYYHNKFIKLPINTRIRKTYILCDIVNTLVDSEHFIGTNDGNLSVFITLLRQNKNVTDIRNQKLLIY